MHAIAGIEVCIKGIAKVVLAFVLLARKVQSFVRFGLVLQFFQRHVVEHVVALANLMDV